MITSAIVNHLSELIRVYSAMLITSQHCNDGSAPARSTISTLSTPNALERAPDPAPPRRPPAAERFAAGKQELWVEPAFGSEDMEEDGAEEEEGEEASEGGIHVPVGALEEGAGGGAGSSEAEDESEEEEEKAAPRGKGKSKAKAAAKAPTKAPAKAPAGGAAEGKRRRAAKAPAAGGKKAGKKARKE